MLREFLGASGFIVLRAGRFGLGGCLILEYPTAYLNPCGLKYHNPKYRICYGAWG